jgi:hypothetical protein
MPAATIIRGMVLAAYRNRRMRQGGHVCPIAVPDDPDGADKSAGRPIVLGEV